MILYIKHINFAYMRLIDEITAFLEDNGFENSIQQREGSDVICVKVDTVQSEKLILPIEITATSAAEAETESWKAHEIIRSISDSTDAPIVITEDRWHSQAAMMQARLLAHLNRFTPIFARNCRIAKIDKTQAEDFLSRNHSYGDAACRYRYGMFYREELIAVATFSNARRWIKEGKEIRSYEWTRYASIPHMRISGGMGKMLKTFIREIQPDDIMSYADLEWSSGEVYRSLGFTLESSKEPVTFILDKTGWKRVPLRPGMNAGNEGKEEIFYFQNFGSNKYRLKLTDYK